MTPEGALAKGMDKDGVDGGWIARTQLDPDGNQGTPEHPKLDE